MAGAWNEGDWGLGNFGEQNNITVPVTSVVDAPLAWNVGNFGGATWGGQFNNIGITLGDETTAGEIREGWGNYTWGSVPWGGEQDPEANVTGQQLNISLNSSLSFVITGSVDLIGQQLNITTGTVEAFASFVEQVTGQQLNISLNSVTLIANANIDVTGQQLNISQGEVDVAPDANVTGEQLNLTLNSVTVTGTATLDLTGQQLNISLNSVIDEANTIAEVSSIAQVGWGVVAWGTQAWNDTEVDITMAIAEGEVDPSPDATVTGIGMTIALDVGTVVIGTANVSVTGEQLNIAQGTAIGDANTLVSVTGIGLNIGVGTIFAGGTSIIEVTGNGLTITLNSINNQIWTEVNTGTDATWTEIDTAA